MEPVSGYLVLEEEAENREAATWTAALRAALADLWVTVAVTGGDEAKGLIAHSSQVGAHHAPDLFHVQHPLWQALVQPLGKSLEGPAATLAKAVFRLRAWTERFAANQEGPRPVGRPPDFKRHIAETKAAEAEAQSTYDAALKLKDDVYAAIRRLGTAYHPVDPESGALRNADTVATDLAAVMATLRTAAATIDLSEKRRDLIEKAGRVIPKMVDTIAFFYAEIGRQLAALALPTELLTYAEQVLIPAAYLSRLAERSHSAVKRNALLAVRQTLLEEVDHACLTLISPTERRHLDRVVLTCVDLFVRSTSCVEGRNGRLSLWHHHLHRLSPKRLAALTVIHNYWIRRPDGSTAAERFFESPHEDLFEWLLDRMDLPARPVAAPAYTCAA
jgi:hypothetical protein